MGLIKDTWAGVIDLMNEEEAKEMQWLVEKRLAGLGSLDSVMSGAWKKKGDGKPPYWIAWVDELEPEAAGKRGRYAVQGGWAKRSDIERHAREGKKRVALVGVRYPEQRYIVLETVAGTASLVRFGEGQEMTLDGARLLFESSEWDEVREALVRFGVPVRDSP